MCPIYLSLVQRMTAELINSHQNMEVKQWGEGGRIILLTTSWISKSNFLGQWYQIPSVGLLGAATSQMATQFKEVTGDHGGLKPGSPPMSVNVILLGHTILSLNICCLLPVSLVKTIYSSYNALPSRRVKSCQ